VRETPGVDESVDLFRTIYERDLWRGGSGEGSTADATVEYRRFLDDLIVSKSVKSVVDVGCGDWQFSRFVDWGSIRYTGVDIVPEVIAGLTHDFGTSRIRFVVADGRTAKLPKADLLVCKDVLQHWPNQAIIDFVERNRRRFRYLLLTDDVWSVHEHAGLNVDVPVGGWRPIDLEVAPFNVHVESRHDFDVRGEWTKRAVLVVR
jgi:SAM-dependent methyltransferase